MDYIEKLNNEQKKAATFKDGPCLVIAGAGSGKTKVLTNTVPIKDLSKLAPQQNAFIYNPKIGAAPKQVDFIIYPYNKKPYKWTIML